MHKDAVNIGARVEFGDEREQLVGGCVGRKRVVFGVESELFRGADFVAHIDGRSRIVADAHGGETGTAAAVAQQTRDALRHFHFDLLSDARAIE